MPAKALAASDATKDAPRSPDAGAKSALPSSDADLTRVRKDALKMFATAKGLNRNWWRFPWRRRKCCWTCANRRRRTAKSFRIPSGSERSESRAARFEERSWLNPIHPMRTATELRSYASNIAWRI